jgi:hypothetical protein
MIHVHDANGSPVSEPVTNQNGDHIRQHADMIHDDLLAPDYATMAPRYRQLDVRDDHAVYLLTLVADDLLRLRRLGVQAPLHVLEMQAALNVMVST